MKLLMPIFLWSSLWLKFCWLPIFHWSLKVVPAFFVHGWFLIYMNINFEHFSENIGQLLSQSDLQLYERIIQKAMKMPQKIGNRNGRD